MKANWEKIPYSKQTLLFEVSDNFRPRCHLSSR
jgi:hypothetical protein